VTFKQTLTAPVLNVQQPWASLILTGRKWIENRSYRTNYRGPVWIYAARRFEFDPMDVDCVCKSRPVGAYDTLAFSIARSLDAIIEKRYPSGASCLDWYAEGDGFGDCEALAHGDCPTHFPTGAIVGMTEIVDVFDMYQAESRHVRHRWYYGDIGWELANTRICRPFLWKGSQGFKWRTKHTFDVEILPPVI
jgi:hypothetical protein